MGVYIKGMEMPKSCDECRIMALEDTNCEAELYCGCPIVFKAHPQGVDHRPDYCPLVPVPPHGRLGDLDALIDKVIAKYLEHERKGEMVFAAAEIKQDIVDLISDAPTIIPADPAEEG